MELGAFSISLAVKDLEASRDFYEKFGFEVVGGDASQNWLILRQTRHGLECRNKGRKSRSVRVERGL